MLKDKVIFVLSLMKFDGLQSSNFTISKYLAKNNEVYYIEHPMTWKDYLKADRGTDSFKIRKNAIKINSTGLLSQKIQGVNILLSHPVFPVDFLPAGALFNFFQRLNEKMIAKRINRILKEKEIKEYIFINAYEFQYPTVNKYLTKPPILSVYYCVDPIPYYHKKHGIELESRVVGISDVIICTSEWLYKQKKEKNNNTHFVPNGSDLVNEINIHTLKSHPSFRNIKGPIVGFIGAIERRIDYELIKETAEKNPDILFAFVGPAAGVPDWFLNKDNIKVMPPVSYHEVPEIIKSFDVCMIPFKKDEISEAIFPLKLFEYLGVGKPVIVTDFNPNLKDFTEDAVQFVNDEISFSNAIRESLVVDDDKGEVEKRIRIAQKNTWKSRAAEFENILNSAILNKNRYD